VSTEPAVVLEDARDGPARTTNTLLASLVVRLRTLALLPGSEAVGSIVAGVAELGRRVASTGEGARIRKALECSRPGVNGELLWSTLHMGDLPSAIPPTPVLEELRNDVALLLAPDLERALAELDETSLTAGIGLVSEPQPVAFLDLVLGLWALSRFAADAVEALAESSAHDADASPEGVDPEDGPLLR
jgi:hypothetical protein